MMKSATISFKNENQLNKFRKLTTLIATSRNIKKYQAEAYLIGKLIEHEKENVIRESIENF